MLLCSVLPSLRISKHSTAAIAVAPQVATYHYDIKRMNDRQLEDGGLQVGESSRSTC